MSMNGTAFLELPIQREDGSKGTVKAFLCKGWQTQIVESGRSRMLGLSLHNGALTASVCLFNDHDLDALIKHLQLRRASIGKIPPA